MIKWLQACISTANYSISVNGEVTSYILGKKGLRQGDPLTSYLFVIVMEVLACLLKEKTILPGVVNSLKWLTSALQIILWSSVKGKWAPLNTSKHYSLSLRLFPVCHPTLFKLTYSFLGLTPLLKLIFWTFMVLDKVIFQWNTWEFLFCPPNSNTLIAKLWLIESPSRPSHGQTDTSLMQVWSN